MKNKSIKKFIICFASAAILICVILYLLGFRITYDPYLENNWDAISGCAAWASALVSGAALIFAICIPERIADEQNKIALFEKRFNCFLCYEKLYGLYLGSIKTDDINELKKELKLFYDIKSLEELDELSFTQKNKDIRAILHQFQFLYTGISDKEIVDLYKNFVLYSASLIDNKDVLVNKKKFIENFVLFHNKYNHLIYDSIKLNDKR